MSPNPSGRAMREYRYENRCSRLGFRSGPMGLSAVARMVTWFLSVFGICRHLRLTFPQTLKSYGAVSATVSCLDCSREFLYDWETMTIVAQLSNPVVLSDPCLKPSSFRKL